MEIRKALPGFVGVRQFFRNLGPKFESVTLGADEARRLKAGIASITGKPLDYVKTAVWAWTASARVLEARRYPGGFTMVRFGVREVDPNTLGLDEDEMQLLVAYDAKGRLKFYSLIHDRGLVEDVWLDISDDAFAAENAGLDDWHLAESFIHNMKDDQFLIISDNRAQRQFFQVLSGPDDEKGGRPYYVEYSLVDYAWQFAGPRYLSASQVVDLVHVLQDGGFLALQEATKWQQMNVNGYWKVHGKRVFVDMWLTSLGMAAEFLGNADLADKCRKAMSLKKPGNKALFVDVNYRAQNCEAEQIRALAEKDSKFTGAERARVKAFAELAESVNRMTCDFKNKKKGKRQ